MSHSAEIFKSVRVDLGARYYDILIGPGLLEQAGIQIIDHISTKRCFIISDDHVAPLYMERLCISLKAIGLDHEYIILPAGENTKSFNNLKKVLDFLLEYGAARNDTLIALGGGVIGDLAGLAAGLCKRGMKFVQIPTSLLAQVDSSVGGKTAINAMQGKNLIGMFYQPNLVLADVGILSTLPKRHWQAGYAEILKYALIDNPEFFDFLDRYADAILAGESTPLCQAIEISCHSKAQIVAQDEREEGKRALLNLGHTFGHALEATNHYGPDLLHGEAVGCGIAMAFRYSTRLGLCSEDITQRVCNHLEKVGLKTNINELSGGPYDLDMILSHMWQDKKNISGALTLILAKNIGQSFIQTNVDPDSISSFLGDELQTR